MKIALIHRYYPLPGGVTTFVKNLKKEFEKKRIDFEIITQQKINEKNVKSINSKNSLFFYFKTYNYLKENRFDLIHSQSSFICFFKPLLKQKIILNIHGFEKAFEYSSLKKYLIENFLGRLKILSYHLADELIAVSKMTKKDLVEKYQISPKKIIAIPNGVDIAIFKPSKRKKNKKIKILQHLAIKRKGFHLLKKWVKEISKKEKNFKIIVFGCKKPKNFEKDLENFFEFRGEIDLTEMPKIYNEGDFFLLASIYDPYGLTAGESLACGKPIIVSKKSGIKDYIQNGKEGFICDFEEFPSKIKLLIKNKNLLKKMSKDARKTAVNKMSSKIFAENYLKEYNKILGGKIK